MLLRPSHPHCSYFLWLEPSVGKEVQLAKCLSPQSHFLVQPSLACKIKVQPLFAVFIPPSFLDPLSADALKLALYKAGVAKLISDKIDFQRGAIKRDPEGHFIILKGRIHQEDINIVNIYIYI